MCDTTDSLTSSQPTGIGKEALVKYLLYLPLLLSFILISSDCKANKLDSIESIFVHSEDAGYILLVTCKVLVNDNLKSPQLFISIVDKDNKHIAEQSSYGGRYYNPEIFTRMGRLTARAAVLSLTPLKADQGERIYQFVFFDVYEKVEKILLSTPDGFSSLRNDAFQPTIHALTQVRILNSDETPLETANQTLYFTKNSDVLSYVESIHKKQIKAPENNSSYKKESERHEQRAFSVEEIKQRFSFYSIIPLWEYLDLGITPDETSRILSDIFNSSEKIDIIPRECVGEICEYELDFIVEKISKVRFYFLNGLLKSIVIALPEYNLAQRLGLIETLRTIYGGQHDINDHGLPIGRFNDGTEYCVVFRGANLKTAGGYIKFHK